MRWVSVVAGMLLGAIAVQARADDVTLDAPGGQLRVRVFVAADGRLSYDVQRSSGRPGVLLNASPLGITVDEKDLGLGVALGACRRSSANETYVWRGGHSRAVNRYNGVEIDVMHVGSHMPYVLDVRAFDDGVGYRYVVPGQGERAVSGEASAWNLPVDCRVWYQNNVSCYEGVYSNAAPASLKAGVKIGFPVTVCYADGSYGALTEAGLFAFSGMSLRATASPRLQGVFEDDASWKESGEIRTPWRVLMTGPDLNALVSCDVVHNLCPAPDPALFPDGFACAWIRPGRSLWNWWSYSSVAFPEQKAWVDQAAGLGFEHYLVDAGWEKAWQSAGKDKWAYLKELCGYAKSKGVGISVWKHWKDLAQLDVEEDFLARCAQAGVAGVKIDFMESESRSRIDFYTRTLKIAARDHLMINFHGANKPTGEPRTYPNEMTREGIRGLEYNRWSELPPEHYATLPFTRYLAGHGDFTPCTFNPEKLKGTTAALQLASAVVFTSPLLHWADHWQRYVDSPAREVIKAVPATWDQTQVLPGSEIGAVAAFARRKGSAWFVGVINGGAARTVPVELSFLADGAYDAVLVRDVAGSPAELRVERVRVAKGQRLEAQTERGGGFVAWMVPAK
jgi:alpha-glucosidase